MLDSSLQDCVKVVLGLHEVHLGCLDSQTYLGAPGFSEWEPLHYV